MGSNEVSPEGAVSLEKAVSPGGAVSPEGAVSLVRAVSPRGAFSNLGDGINSISIVSNLLFNS